MNQPTSDSSSVRFDVDRGQHPGGSVAGQRAPQYCHSTPATSEGVVDQRVHQYCYSGPMYSEDSIGHSAHQRAHWRAHRDANPYCQYCPKSSLDAVSVSMAPILANLTSRTSDLAHLYFLTGRDYHSDPNPVCGLRKAFTVSPNRELPELITIFGMLQQELFRARVAMMIQDVDTMFTSLWMANVLLLEAWYKVAWFDWRLETGPGEWEEYDEFDEFEDGDEDGEAFEKWRAALPSCCGALPVLEKQQDQDEQGCPIETWRQGVASC